MTVQHSAIAEANLHEPKGVSTATTGKISKAASGVVAWEFPEFILNLDIENIVTDTSYFIPVPYACNIIGFKTAIDNAFTTADCTIALEIAGVAVTDGSITITQSGSAAGDVDTVTPTAANAVAAGGSIEVVVSGSNATTTRCHVTLIILRTA